MSICQYDWKQVIFLSNLAKRRERLAPWASCVWWPRPMCWVAALICFNGKKYCGCNAYSWCVSQALGRTSTSWSSKAPICRNLFLLHFGTMHSIAKLAMRLWEAKEPFQQKKYSNITGFCANMTLSYVPACCLQTVYMCCMCIVFDVCSLCYDVWRP